MHVILITMWHKLLEAAHAMVLGRWALPQRASNPTVIKVILSLIHFSGPPVSPESLCVRLLSYIYTSPNVKYIIHAKVYKAYYMKPGKNNKMNSVPNTQVKNENIPISWECLKQCFSRFFDPKPDKIHVFYTDPQPTSTVACGLM